MIEIYDSILPEEAVCMAKEISNLRGFRGSFWTARPDYYMKAFRQVDDPKWAYGILYHNSILGTWKLNQSDTGEILITNHWGKLLRNLGNLNMGGAIRRQGKSGYDEVIDIGGNIITRAVPNLAYRGIFSDPIIEWPTVINLSVITLRHLSSIGFKVGKVVNPRFDLLQPTKQPEKDRYRIAKDINTVLAVLAVSLFNPFLP